jgi:eukaryotic-like serine/threonine-protein kinase
MPDEHLLEIVSAVADARPIDWKAVEESATSEEDRLLLRELRHISTLSGLTRTLTEDEPPSEAAGASITKTAARMLPQWGAFALMERIGGGAQGEVFRALDLRLQRDVALKLRHAAPSTVDPEGFLTEARLLARVRHANVVTVHGADVVDGRVGLWMELVKGETLEHIVHERGPMSSQEATLVGVSLCGAVNAVHNAGLLHRDIKAQNVMRESGGRYVLMDFGVGRDIASHGPTGSAGTPVYLAPEVLAGSPATIQSEVYAIGVLLHFLVTGAVPYSATSMAGLTEAHRLPRQPLQHKRHDLPPEFCAAIERALSPDPAGRFSSVSEFADALAGTLPRATTGLRLPGKGTWLALALVSLVAAGLWFVARSAPVTPAQTVAVLPFQDLSPDQSARHLAQGLTDLLTTSLGARTDLRVLARTTAQEFVGNNRPLEMARQVGADRLIEGSVAPDGGRLRVALRVVHAGSGATLWAGDLSGTVGALGALEEQMVSLVAAHLGKIIEPLASAARWQADAASLEDYFRGWGEYWRQSKAGFREAQRLFLSAATRSPSFAEAHAAYAYARLTGELSYREPTYEEGVQAARASADRALALNPNSALAEATIGWAKFYVEWDWVGAESHLRRAVEMNPSDAQVRWMYGQFLMAQNRIDAALSEAKLVQRLDPLNVARHSHVAAVLYYGRRFEEARQEYEQVLARDPNAAYARFGLSRMLSALGRHDESLAFIRSASNVGEPQIAAELARQLFVAGHTDEARQLFKSLESDYRSGRLAPDYFAYVHLAEGDRDGALTLIEEAVRARSGTVIWIHVDPRFDALRQEPRFVEALKQMRFVTGSKPVA